MKLGVFALPLVLGACVMTVNEPAPVAPGPIVPGPGCDQTALDPAQIIGRRPEELGLERFPFPVRVIAPGMAVTMDYSASRLNLETDAEGRIVRFHCG
jgi:hypothetical protein